MKHRAFPGRGPAVDAKYERSAKWLLATIYGKEAAAQWCRANSIPIVKAASEGIGQSGGYLVPADLQNAILDLRELYGAFRRRARVVPMVSDHTQVPRHAGGSTAGGGLANSTTAYFPGENNAPTETQSAVDGLSLTAKKVAALVRTSSEADEDTASGIVDYVANEIAWAFAAKEDDCAFNGDGTAQYAKMIGLSQIVLDGKHNAAKITAASGHNTFLTLDGTDLGNLMKAIRASAMPNASWFCSVTAFAQTFCRLTAGSGYLETRVVDGISTPFYLGFPVILTQKLPLIATSLTSQVMMAFGDMYAAGVLGERRGVTIARSEERYMDSDQIGILGTERFHAVIHDVGDNTAVGAIAALVGN
jgi:HK97 family phage major capsid protein